MSHHGCRAIPSGAGGNSQARSAPRRWSLPQGVGQRQQGAQADGDAVQEIAPRDGLVHAEKTVFQTGWS